MATSCFVTAVNIFMLIFYPGMLYSFRYDIELAFYIDKKGKRVRKDWSISWEGNPTAFAFRFPYVVAFNANFIEVRHMDTVSNNVHRTSCSHVNISLG